MPLPPLTFAARCHVRLCTHSQANSDSHGWWVISKYETPAPSGAYRNQQHYAAAPQQQYASAPPQGYAPPPQQYSAPATGADYGAVKR